MTKKWFTILVPLAILTSCQQAKNKGKELIDKSATKAKETAQEAWKKGMDKAFDALTTTEKTSFQKIFKTADSLNVQDIDGLRIEFPASFYYCFLKYHGDRDTILNYITTLRTRLPEISDETYYRTDTTELFENLTFIDKEYHDIKGRLDFFYEIKNKDNLEYYKYNKYPNTHYVVVDSKTRTIFHHFESYRD